MIRLKPSKDPCIGCGEEGAYSILIGDITRGTIIHLCNDCCDDMHNALRPSVDVSVPGLMHCLWPILPDDIRDMWREHTDRAYPYDFFRDVMQPWLEQVGQGNINT